MDFIDRILFLIEKRREIFLNESESMPLRRRELRTPINNPKIWTREKYIKIFEVKRRYLAPS